MLAPWLISFFPVHRVYTEAFGGGGAVLMRKPRAYSEVYNDRWDTVVNVFQVLRNDEAAAELARRIALTPYARREFEGTYRQDLQSLDTIDRARLTILRSLAGFGSASVNPDHATGFRANSMRSGTTPAHDWHNYPNHVPAFTARLSGVVIENREAIDVIRQHDSPQTLHYVDPPYPQSTRGFRRRNAAYSHEMSDDDHRALAGTLRQVQGMTALSGYACDLYDKELYPDWTRYERQHMADGARPRTEVLWVNTALQHALQLYGPCTINEATNER